MIFRTELKVKPSSSKISHKKPIFLLGSCFSDNMGSLFSKYKFQVIHNPFGISYNPISLVQQLKRIISQKEYNSTDIFEDEGVFKSFELHSSQAGLKEEELLSNLNFKLKESHDQLERASHLFITLGTSWVYSLKSSGQVVNNCHKIPSTQFNKQLLKLDEITTSLREMIIMMKELNPEIEIIFTVSPVRHLRDGIENNTLSKSILRLAIHQLSEEHACMHFPSNEILLDDLRDYRFYKSDLIHPNEVAQQYIWEKLSNVFFTQETSKLIDLLDSFRKAIGHRAFQPNSNAHKEFIQNSIRQAKEIQEKYSEIDLEEEIKLLLEKLPE